MSVLVDTNVLLRLVEPAHPSHQTAMRATRDIGERLVITAQTIYEFWVVGTRPRSVGGLELAPAAVEREIDRLGLLFDRLPEDDAIFHAWHGLVVAHGVMGKPAHDARIVAAMLVHDLNTIMTFNAKDFLRYPDISVLTPQEVLSR